MDNIKRIALASLMPFHLEKQIVAPGARLGNYIKGMKLQVKHKDDTRQGVIGNGVVIALTQIISRRQVGTAPQKTPDIFGKSLIKHRQQKESCPRN